MASPLISLVVPVFNEEEIIEELFTRTVNTLKQITDNFEIICVEDGSTDNTLAKLIQCHQVDNRFKVLILSRNFGHQSAYTAGLEYSTGEYIVMLDGDLQDPPELIKEMYDKIIQEQCAVVYGKRIKRQEKLVKKVLIKIFHLIFHQVVKGEQDSGNFSMFTRLALSIFLSLKEKNRYLPGLRSYIGFKQGYVEYTRQSRAGGEAKMNFGKLVNLSLDAFFSFSSFPIKICLFIGLVGVALFFMALIYTLVGRFTGIAPFGWSSTILSIYLVASIQLLFLGIIGEYIFRIYKEIQSRPIYIIKEFLK